MQRIRSALAVILIALIAGCVGCGGGSGSGSNDPGGDPISITGCSPSGPIPDALLSCRAWISFAPPKPFNPNTNTFPTEGELRVALQQLADEGWRGLVTYSLDGSLSEVPRLAKEVGFTKVIAGLYWYDSAQLSRERAAALANTQWIDGFVLGNEGLLEGRYSRDDLIAEIARLKADTGLPVTTSEVFDVYLSDPDITALGDWLFPNLQFWSDTNLRDPATAANAVYNQVQTLASMAPGVTLVVKEAWYPSAGEAAATEANQVAFFGALAALPVKFVFGEAYDQDYKSEPLGQGPNWGYHTYVGSPKMVIGELQEIYTGAY